jgi:hypothetical protein
LCGCGGFWCSLWVDLFLVVFLVWACFWRLLGCGIDDFVAQVAWVLLVVVVGVCCVCFVCVVAFVMFFLVAKVWILELFMSIIPEVCLAFLNTAKAIMQVTREMSVANSYSGATNKLLGNSLRIASPIFEVNSVSSTSKWLKSPYSP